MKIDFDIHCEKKDIHRNTNCLLLMSSKNFSPANLIKMCKRALAPRKVVNHEFSRTGLKNTNRWIINGSEQEEKHEYFALY